MNCTKSLEKFSPYALLILRLSLGVIFTVHGYNKLVEPGMVIGMVTNLGFPIPVFFAWALILSEFLGGISLILGLFTRLFSAFLVFAMGVALFMVHLKNGLLLQNGGIEYVLVLLSTFLVFLGYGGGKFSLDQLLFKGKI